MAPILSFLISSGSEEKEPRLNETKASHSHKMWTEVSFSVPHFLQVGLLLSPSLHLLEEGTEILLLLQSLCVHQ